MIKLYNISDRIKLIILWLSNVAIFPEQKTISKEGCYANPYEKSYLREKASIKEILWLKRIY